MKGSPGPPCRGVELGGLRFGRQPVIEGRDPRKIIELAAAGRSRTRVGMFLWNIRATQGTKKTLPRAKKALMRCDDHGRSEVVPR